MMTVSTTETEPLTARLPLAAAALAFFIDFDGTLAPIVTRPEDAVLAPGTIEILQRLDQRCAGAVALVSGRSIADLDPRVAPLVLPIAGQHGAERRDAAGQIHRAELDSAPFVEMADRLEAELGAVEGLELERKRFGVAVHYRNNPDAEPLALAAVQRRLDAMGPAFVLQRGKMVFELKAALVSKGLAIDQFMAEQPFAGRLPLAAGDDLTDEYAFEAVNRVGGISIKIGAGPTVAQHRVADERAFVAWLAGAVG